MAETEFNRNERVGRYEPVELYKFEYGGQTFCYTSGDVDVTFGGNTYVATTIKRSEIEVTNDIAKSTLKIMVDKNNEIAVTFIRGSLTSAMFITIWYAQYIGKEMGTPILMYDGRATTCDFSGVEAKINCEPIFTGLKRMGLRRKYETTCSHILFDEHCGVSKAANTLLYTGFTLKDSKTLTIAKPTSGKLVERNIIDSRYGHYTGGLAKWGSYEFFINRHIITEGSTVEIELLRHIPDTVVVPSSISLVSGCDHSISTCSSFSNILNFSGFPLIPDKNPFRDTNVPAGGK